jgi:hypothetical protein
MQAWNRQNDFLARHPPGAVPHSTFGQLNDDVLMRISGLHAGGNLKMVNQRTWKAVTDADALNPYQVPGQRGAYYVTEDSVRRMIGEIESSKYSGKVLRIHLFLPSFPPIVRMEILNLYKEIWAQGGGLRTLHVALLEDNIEGVGPEAVRLMAEEILRRSSLYNCNFLEELKLDFSDLSSSLTHTKMGVPGCKAFWMLSRYKVIHTLSLDLTGNELGDEGVRLLVTGPITENLVHLRKLYLGLKNNSITSEGLSRLGVQLIKITTSLEDLHIDLQDNSIGDHGAFYLSTLGGHRNLHTLRLVCTNNVIGDQGAKYLTNLIVRCRSISDLYLNLDRNLIGSEGVSDMHTAMTITPITDVEVHMHGNPGSTAMAT